MDFGWKESFTCIRLLDSWENFYFQKTQKTRFTIDNFVKILYMKKKTPKGLSNEDAIAALLEVYIVWHKSRLSGGQQRWDQVIMPLIYMYMCLACWPILFKCH